MSQLVDPVTLTVTGAQYEAFMEALVDAFPEYPALARMTQFRLELSLARIAGSTTPIDQVAFQLIQDQKSKGHFLRLLDAARASRPGNPKLAFFWSVSLPMTMEPSTPAFSAMRRAGILSARRTISIPTR